MFHSAYDTRRAEIDIDRRIGRVLRANAELSILAAIDDLDPADKAVVTQVALEVYKVSQVILTKLKAL